MPASRHLRLAVAPPGETPDVAADQESAVRLPPPAKDPGQSQFHKDRSAEADSYAATAYADVIDRSLHAATARLPLACRRRPSWGRSPTGPFTWRRLQASECCWRKRRSARRAGLAAMPCDAPMKAVVPNPASNRCRRTTVSAAKHGGNGPIISSPRVFSCTSNGGTTPPPG